MTYRVPKEWIASRRRMARWVPGTAGALGLGILLLVLAPRVRWSKPQDVRAAIIVSAVVCFGLILGGIAGRFSFRNSMQHWESFQIEITPEEITRQMGGQEVRIRRTNVASIRVFPRRGFVITDKLGWRIYVPKIVDNYDEFRQCILT